MNDGLLEVIVIETHMTESWFAPTALVSLIARETQR